ncbi:MAG: zinc ribbon domain-containing protein [Thermoanaerobaculia bacterium]
MEAKARTESKARNFPCAACGADVLWDPSAASLKCPYCGAVRALPASAATLVEHPIDEALRAPREVGWGAARKAVKCGRCGAVTTFAVGVSAAACAFCGASAVIESPLNATMVRPEGLLAFAVDRNNAVGKFRTWISGLWFRPNALKSQSSVTGMSGVYVPYWTFDAATRSAWTAEAGFHYQVQVQAVENGQTVMRSETRTRWEPAEGMLDRLFDDVAVEASKGLTRSLAESIEPFPTAALVPYEPAYLAGFLAEEYALGVHDAVAIARQRMADEIRAACAAAVPGDTYRDLEVHTDYAGVSYKNALLPIWIAAYQYAGKPYRFLVNGVTGKVAGEAPYSWVKITLAVLAALVLLAVFSSLKN